MEYENKFVGLSSVMSHDLEILRYELEYGWKLARCVVQLITFKISNYGRI